MPRKKKSLVHNQGFDYATMKEKKEEPVIREVKAPEPEEVIADLEKGRLEPYKPQAVNNSTIQEKPLIFSSIPPGSLILRVTDKAQLLRSVLNMFTPMSVVNVNMAELCRLFKEGFLQPGIDTDRGLEISENQEVK